MSKLIRFGVHGYGRQDIYKEDDGEFVLYEDYAALEARVKELDASNSAKGRCLAFFACVIKTGEPWTETCQREYDAAQLRQSEEKGQ